MNSTSLMDKVELSLYSTLISVLSGIRQIKESERQVAGAAGAPVQILTPEASALVNPVQEKKFSIHWASIQQTLLAIVLWVVLGFAAGFLVGMLRVG